MKFALAAVGLLGALLVSLPCFAQYVVVQEQEGPPVPVEVTPMGGYVFRNGVPGPGGATDIGASPAFGAAVDIGDWYGARLELAYLLQGTDVESEPYAGPVQSLYGLTLHNFQIGGEFDILRGRVRPFVGFTLGAALFVPSTDVPDELWFEAAFEGGAKVMLTHAVGLRAQAQLLAIVLDPTSRIFCGNGCYVPSWGSMGTTQVALSIGPTVVF